MTRIRSPTDRRPEISGRAWLWAPRSGRDKYFDKMGNPLWSLRRTLISTSSLRSWSSLFRTSTARRASTAAWGGGSTPTTPTASDFRVIQFTPPGSGCSVIFGKDVTGAAPGSAQGLYLIVSDIKAARDELISRGVEISEVFHDANGVYAGTDEPYLFGRRRVGGLDPEHRSYRSFASFRDPDGNGWLLQEITCDCPDAWTRTARPSPRRPSLRPRSDARRPRTASTRSGPANPIRTGRIGTPTTSSGSRSARSCRHERRIRLSSSSAAARRETLRRRARRWRVACRADQLQDSSLMPGRK